MQQITEEIQKITDELSESIKGFEIKAEPEFYFDNSESTSGSNSFDYDFLKNLQDNKDLTKEYINIYTL
jgi:hypothetical protein